MSKTTKDFLETNEDLFPEDKINLEDIDPVDLAPFIGAVSVGSTISYENTLDYPVVLEVLDPLFSQDREDNDAAKEFRYYSNKEEYWFKYYGLGESAPKNIFLIRSKTEEVLIYQFPMWIVEKYWELQRKEDIDPTIRLRFNLHTKEGVIKLLSKKIFIK